MVCAAHLIAIREWLPALDIVGDQTPDLAVGIPVQKIEWTQVRSYCSQSSQALLSGPGRRPLVRQDDLLGPIGEAHPGQQPGCLPVVVGDGIVDRPVTVFYISTARCG